MGLRFRTPIGSLREQRRKAEGQVPAQVGRVATTRYRNSNGVDASMPVSDSEFGKRENLIERLRSVLADGRNDIDESLSEYQVIQDELARISHHQQVNRTEGSEGLIDLDVPRTMFFNSAAPFRYVVIDGGKKTNDFNQPLQRLNCAPVNLDAYVQNVRPLAEPAPRAVPLTLLLSSDPEPNTPKIKADPSFDAATLTQSNVTHNSLPKERSLIPKSLVLSLLDDK
ncbi:MAG: hypothetical protein H7249_16045 [Chitinophagaceae bacterium]|nr:hypothetical protein [Oligoflexus sp.]